MFTPTRASYAKVGAQMRQQLAALTVTQRQALYLSVVDGRPIHNVAHLLDMPEDAAEQIAATARSLIYEAVAS